MNTPKKVKIRKQIKVTDSKNLVASKEALTKTLQNFNKAFAEYYKGFC